MPNDIGEMYWLMELTIEGNDDLDDEFYMMGGLHQVLNHIASSQSILKKYKDQHMEYLNYIKTFRAEIKIMDGRHELKDKRMVGFLYLLSKKPYRDEFEKFLNKEYASESLAFYEEVIGLRQKFYSDYILYTKELFDYANSIYRKYINPEDDDDEGMLINIPSDIKNRIIKAFETNNVNQFVFTESKVYILTLMLNDSLSRFIENDGKEIWSIIKQKLSTIK